MRDTDRRVIYTKKLLRDSLLTLMEEKPVSRISVTELCKIAGVNRGTFYSHYREPKDVLDNMEEELFGDISEILSTFSDPRDIFRAILMTLHRSRAVCRMLISHNGDPECISRIEKISLDYFEENLRNKLNLDPITARYLHAFMFSGTVAVLREWLTNDPGRSPEEIADTITSMQARLIK